MDRQKYKESNLSDKFTTGGQTKYKESHLSDHFNNMWIDKCTKKVIYLTKLTTCGQTKVQRKSFI